MKLFEYQAKEVFAENGIPVPNSVLITESSQLDTALETVGLPCVVKSQVLSGGRGKAGLIKVVQTAEEASTEVKRLFAHEIGVGSLLIEEAINIETELYLSVTVDPVDAKALVIACSEGGVDIETLAVEAPDKILKEPVDINTGLMSFQATNLAYKLGLSVDIAKQVTKVIYRLYQIFRKFDAELVEINPLFITKEGTVIAGDGKLSIDDNSMHRQTRFEPTKSYYKTEAEFEAAEEGIPFIQFDGDIGLMCAGAGLTTTVYDLINYEGGNVANYLEFGGPNYKKAVKAMEICLKVPSKVILICTFGTIARADVMAEGVVDAIKRLKPDRPIVACIRGTNEAEAVRILNDAGLECIFDTEEAVQKAVAIAGGLE